MKVKSPADTKALDNHVTFKVKECQRLFSMVEKNWQQKLAKLTAQYNASPSASVSKQTFR